jgi:hypothetical protein
VPAWLWWLLAALVLALAVGIPLLVRSRRRSAWQAELASTEEEVAWLARDLVPELRRSGSREQAAGGWAVSSARVGTLEDRLTALTATAPDDPALQRATTLRDAVRASRTRLDALATPGTDQSLSTELDAVVTDLESALRPPQPGPAPGSGTT